MKFYISKYAGVIVAEDDGTEVVYVPDWKKKVTLQNENRWFLYCLRFEREDINDEESLP